MLDLVAMTRSEHVSLWLVGVLTIVIGACGGSSGASPSDAADAATTETGDAPATVDANDVDANDVEVGLPTCAAYCASIQTACTGSNQQYSDMDDCVNSCKAFPVGDSSDTLGDTLGCRTYHAGAARTDDPSIHCVHAGPGGNSICGDDCGGYCDIVMLYCTDANSAKIYDTRDQCLADCHTRTTTLKYTTGDPGRTDMGNEVACVLYHAQMGSSAPVSHCLGDLALTAKTCRPE